MDDVVIEDDVMGLEALDNLHALDAADQDSGSEVSDADSWDTDPILRSNAILKAAASGQPSDGQLNTLSEAGSIGLAAAAAILSSKRRGTTRLYHFETNPAVRKRQQTRLLGKIRALCGEYCTRVGQQAVFIAAVPGKHNATQTNNFKIIGSSPFDSVIRNNKQVLISELDEKIAEYEPQPEPVSTDSDGLPSTELPPVLIDGIPASIDQMTQAMLRNFIPVLLKQATGRGKPGWGVSHMRPCWWPNCLPWANIRRDMRSEEQKQLMGWTDALKEVVKCCYRHFKQEDTLTPFPPDPPKAPTDHSVTHSSTVTGGSIHQIVSSAGSQLILAATDSNGFTIHIPVSMCQVSHDPTRGQQIQLVMPATPPISDDLSRTYTRPSFDIVSLDSLNSMTAPKKNT